MKVFNRRVAALTAFLLIITSLLPYTTSIALADGTSSQPLDSKGIPQVPVTEGQQASQQSTLPPVVATSPLPSLVQTNDTPLSLEPIESQPPTTIRVGSHDFLKIDRDNHRAMLYRGVLLETSEVETIPYLNLYESTVAPGQNDPYRPVGVERLGSYLNAEGQTVYIYGAQIFGPTTYQNLARAMADLLGQDVTTALANAIKQTIRPEGLTEADQSVCQEERQTGISCTVARASFQINGINYIAVLKGSTTPAGLEQTTDRQWRPVYNIYSINGNPLQSQRFERARTKLLEQIEAMIRTEQSQVEEFQALLKTMLEQEAATKEKFLASIKEARTTLEDLVKKLTAAETSDATLASDIRTFVSKVNDYLKNSIDQEIQSYLGSLSQGSGHMAYKLHSTEQYLKRLLDRKMKIQSAKTQEELDKLGLLEPILFEVSDPYTVPNPLDRLNGFVQEGNALMTRVPPQPRPEIQIKNVLGKQGQGVDGHFEAEVANFGSNGIVELVLLGLGPSLDANRPSETRLKMTQQEGTNRYGVDTHLGIGEFTYRIEARNSDQEAWVKSANYNVGINGNDPAPEPVRPFVGPVKFSNVFIDHQGDSFVIQTNPDRLPPRAVITFFYGPSRGEMTHSIEMAALDPNKPNHFTASAGWREIFSNHSTVFYNIQVQVGGVIEGQSNVQQYTYAEDVFTPPVTHSNQNETPYHLVNMGRVVCFSAPCPLAWSLQTPIEGPGSYEFKILAVDQNGGTVNESEPQVFTITQSGNAQDFILQGLPNHASIRLSGGVDSLTGENWLLHVVKFVTDAWTPDHQPKFAWRKKGDTAPQAASTQTSSNAMEPSSTVQSSQTLLRSIASSEPAQVAAPKPEVKPSQSAVTNKATSLFQRIGRGLNSLPPEKRADAIRRLINFILRRKSRQIQTI